ncbi:alkaline phosphatase [uncultured Porphyromonas sp.]|uniref:alkaline phosphatase n=1 Tax=uncultured Porphyromonas sp. TaxID=159274 RepID=UPI00261034A8|nr:alkaline phosphatase [uncultured Porphyromonas sp.]
MKRTLCILATLFLALPQLMVAEQPTKPVKNVIFMISDGTSLSTISLARWYQNLQADSLTRLHLDPYMSGTVLTFCSDAPIGDSAPTTSTYMNGMPSIQGMVGTYPYATSHDLVPVDSAMAYRPIVSLMEATRLLQNRKVGVVITCEFPHATPADATAHSYSRKRYDWIIPQMVHNHLDVVIGGGAGLISEEQVNYLKGDGYGVYLNDYASLKTNQKERMWSLFSHRDIPYDMDGVAGKDPKLSEMVTSALTLLNRDNPNGFFLLVEGSKVDWAAHANDPVAMATEFLAFDRAVQVALDFAKADGNTIVVLTADHGNSGLSIGRGDLRNYAGTSKEKLFGPLIKIQKSSVGLANMIKAAEESELPRIFEEVTTFAPTEEELVALKLLRQLELAPDAEREAIKQQLKALSISGEGALYTAGLADFIASIYRNHMYLGFTTHGHTAEDVFLASYAPTEEQRLRGVHSNMELHNYLRKSLGLGPTMLELTDKYFAPHSEVFSGLKVTITGEEPKDKVLTVKKGRKTLSIKSYTNQLYLNGKLQQLSLPVVYVDKTDQFYLPTSLRALLDK